MAFLIPLFLVFLLLPLLGKRDSILGCCGAKKEMVCHCYHPSDACAVFHVVRRHLGSFKPCNEKPNSGVVGERFVVPMSRPSPVICSVAWYPCLCRLGGTRMRSVPTQQTTPPRRALNSYPAFGCMMAHGVTPSIAEALATMLGSIQNAVCVR
ncbi:hypothetical protein GW17_00010246 [Ensete ventricosum]|nr:hypothetical protein GW17_00010246 [Ensete ventricosum]